MYRYFPLAPIVPMMISEEIPPVLKDTYTSSGDMFDFTYPSFEDTTKKTALETKIYNHYSYRRLCVVEPEKFHDYLSNKMNEIMPYYLQVYASAELQFDPLKDYELSESISDSIQKAIDKTGKVTEDTGVTDAGTKTGTVSDDSTVTENISKTGTIGVEVSDITTHNITNTDTKNLTNTDATDVTTIETGSKERSDALSNFTNIDEQTTKTEEKDTQTTRNDNVVENTAGTDTNNLTEKVTNEDSTTVSNTQKHSETPQGSIANIDNYMTDATVDSKSDTKSQESEKKNTGTVNHTNQNETTTESGETGSVDVNTTGRVQTAHNDVSTQNTTDDLNTTKTESVDATHTESGTDTNVKTGTETVARTDDTATSETGTNNTIKESDISTSETLSKTTSKDSTIDTTDSTDENTTRTASTTKTGKVTAKNYSEMLLDYRKTLLNIDNMVISELSELFYNLLE